MARVYNSAAAAAGAGITSGAEGAGEMRGKSSSATVTQDMLSIMLAQLPSNDEPDTSLDGTDGGVSGSVASSCVSGDVLAAVSAAISEGSFTYNPIVPSTAAATTAEAGAAAEAVGTPSAMFNSQDPHNNDNVNINRSECQSEAVFALEALQFVGPSSSSLTLNEHQRQHQRQQHEQSYTGNTNETHSSSHDYYDTAAAAAAATAAATPQYAHQHSNQQQEHRNIPVWQQQQHAQHEQRDFNNSNNSYHPPASAVNDATMSRTSRELAVALAAVTRPSHSNSSFVNASTAATVGSRVATTHRMPQRNNNNKNDDRISSDSTSSTRGVGNNDPAQLALQDSHRRIQEQQQQQLHMLATTTSTTTPAVNGRNPNTRTSSRIENLPAWPSCGLNGNGTTAGGGTGVIPSQTSAAIIASMAAADFVSSAMATKQNRLHDSNKPQRGRGHAFVPAANSITTTVVPTRKRRRGSRTAAGSGGSLAADEEDSLEPPPFVDSLVEGGRPLNSLQMQKLRDVTRIVQLMKFHELEPLRRYQPSQLYDLMASVAEAWKNSGKAAWKKRINKIRENARGRKAPRNHLDASEKAEIATLEQKISEREAWEASEKVKMMPVSASSSTSNGKNKNNKKSGSKGNIKLKNTSSTSSSLSVSSTSVGGKRQKQASSKFKGAAAKSRS